MTPNRDFIAKRLGGKDAVWNKLLYDRDGIIEASAGTGKTYALQSIVLKLVSDETHPVDIKNILLVTYTEKAAGELKDRIRTILQDADCLQSDFDEATICTIHSFCRELLTAYAFENRVPMEMDIGCANGDFIHRAVRAALLGAAFKASYSETYAAFMEAGGFGSTEGLVGGAERKLSECAMKDEPPPEPPHLDGAMRTTLMEIAASTSLDFDGISIHGTDRPKFLDACEKVRTSIDGIGAGGLTDFVLSVISCANGCAYLNPRVTGMGRGTRLQDVRPDLKRFAEMVQDVYGIVASQLVGDLVQWAWPEFRRLKDESAALTFDDLVTRASRVIEEEAAHEESGGRSALLESIRRRYRIALVDEFQDTDKMQWTIFRRIFGAKANRMEGDDVPAPRQGFLLVVGDPKQAIYGFRGADVATYLSAKEAITVGDGTQPPQMLNATYRSARELVVGFNAIFGEESGWFNDMTEDDRRIDYAKVDYPEDNARFARLVDLTGRPAVNLLESLPYQLPDLPNNRGGYGNMGKCLPVFMENAALEMKRLHDLPVAYKTYDEKKQAMVDHRFDYGDMCVLVRGGGGARIVKRVLAQHGIPYAHYKERGLFATEEAEALLALFDFLAAPSRTGNLAALLLTSFFGIPPGGLESRLARGDREFSELVEKWQELTKNRNWNKLFESVMDDTSLAYPVMGDYEYDRRWMAIRQMLDKLLEAKGRSALVIDEFAGLLRSWRKDDQNAGEDGSLRQKESEGERVQIMTMHASKGLEFGVVFVAAGMGNVNSDEVNDEKRLLYVALTRAEHKLYLPWTKWSPHLRAGKPEHGLGSRGSFLLGEGCLSRGIRTLFKEPVVVDFGRDESALDAETAAFHAGRSHSGVTDPVKGEDIGRAGCPQAAVPMIYNIGYLKNRTMQWDSFTTLNGHGRSQRLVPDASGELDELRIPCVKTKTLLPGTNVSGIVFHEIMETLCGNDDAAGEIGFTIGKRTLDAAMSDENFAEIVRHAMRANALGNQIADDDSTELTLMRMVWNALNTALAFGERTFFLKDIAPSDRRAEVEFVLDEENVLGADLPPLGGRPRDGVFNGSIDLLIRPDGEGGKVYIVDWKTNTLDDYGTQSVSAAMEAAGYPLQFKLYSLAASQWLGEDALAGVAYLFVRGGEFRDARSGVYARAADEAFMDDCRTAVLAALPHSTMAD